MIPPGSSLSSDCEAMVAVPSLVLSFLLVLKTRRNGRSWAAKIENKGWRSRLVIYSFVHFFNASDCKRCLKQIFDNSLFFVNQRSSAYIENILFLSLFLRIYLLKPMKLWYFIKLNSLLLLCGQPSISIKMVEIGLIYIQYTYVLLLGPLLQMDSFAFWSFWLLKNRPQILEACVAAICPTAKFCKNKQFFTWNLTYFKTWNVSYYLVSTYYPVMVQVRMLSFCEMYVTCSSFNTQIISVLTGPDSAPGNSK